MSPGTYVLASAMAMAQVISGATVGGMLYRE
jgi:hypothetical protein